MTSPLQTVTVTLVHTPRRKWTSPKRWQPWRWTVTAANGRILAHSGESYTNKADAVDAIWALFGTAAFVRLRNTDGSYYTLRSGIAEVDCGGSCCSHVTGDDER